MLTEQKPTVRTISSKVDGTIENSMLKYDVEYRTDIAKCKVYVAVYDDKR